jgi:hypothetical protein
VTDRQCDAQFLVILTHQAGTNLIFEIAHPARDDFHRIVINFDEAVFATPSDQRNAAADEVRGGTNCRWLD